MEKFRMSFPKQIATIDDGSLFVGSKEYCFAPGDYEIMYEDKDSILIEFWWPRHCPWNNDGKYSCHWAADLAAMPEPLGCLWCETYGNAPVRPL